MTSETSIFFPMFHPGKDDPNRNHQTAIPNHSTPDQKLWCGSPQAHWGEAVAAVIMRLCTVHVTWYGLAV